jgi:enoyl-[acyl-carrier protein] reductase I
LVRLDEQSIAWKVAQRCHEEGAEIVLTNAPMALRMGELNKLAEECNAPVIPAMLPATMDVRTCLQKHGALWRRR